MQHYLKDVEIAHRFGVSRATIWRWVKNNQFPEPVKFSTCCTRWKLAEIEAWQSAQEGGVQ